MKRFEADLHIHTALSPCASREMTPPAIVRAAVQAGLAMIAICDHNSGLNIAATQEAAGETLGVIAGMEIMTSEEAHVLGFFPNAEEACEAGREVAATLPDLSDAAGTFGEQQVMDAAGRATGMESKMLAAASRFSLEETVRLIKRRHGLAVAAHVNRPSFSVVSQLGLFPLDAGFDAVEIFSSVLFSIRAKESAAYGLPRISSSDSHYLLEIGSARTRLELRRPAFEELVLALRGEGGRGVCYA